MEHMLIQKVATDQWGGWTDQIIATFFLRDKCLHQECFPAIKMTRRGNNLLQRCSISLSFLCPHRIHFACSTTSHGKTCLKKAQRWEQASYEKVLPFRFPMVCKLLAGSCSPLGSLLVNHKKIRVKKTICFPKLSSYCLF